MLLEEDIKVLPGCHPELRKAVSKPPQCGAARSSEEPRERVDLIQTLEVLNAPIMDLSIDFQKHRSAVLVACDGKRLMMMAERGSSSPLWSMAIFYEKFV